jgi:hypothetical protein
MLAKRFEVFEMADALIVMQAKVLWSGRSSK